MESIEEDPSTLNFLRDPIGRYEIECKLGEGGYGSVYRAKNRKNGETVALKVVRCDASNKEIMNEIEFLMSCQSPYIIGYRDNQSDEERLWLAMEFCEHGSLNDIMEKNGMTFNEVQIAGILYYTLQGLSYIHSSSKMHRDIKGSNILLNSSGICKIADFGASAELTQTMRRRYTFIGSPFWMAPECLVENAYDTAADIWSLGITVIELLSGSPPLYNETPMMIIYKIPRDPPPKIPDASSYSPELNDFVAKCLNKDEIARPSADDLLRVRS